MPDKIFATLSIETAKRGGKKVTVIKNLPAIEGYLKDLAKELKQKCGTGGTHGIDSQSGYIEIQGDRRTDLRPLLLARKINVKG